MTDPRIKTLAHNLINYSCELKEGEKIFIENIGLEPPLLKELIREAYKAGAIPFVSIKDNEINRVLLSQCTEEQMKLMAKYEAARMTDADAYIGVRSGRNSAELSDVPADRMELYMKHFWQE